MSWLRLLPDATPKLSPMPGPRPATERTKAPPPVRSVESSRLPGIEPITEPISSSEPAGSAPRAAASAPEPTAGPQDTPAAPLRLDPSVLRQASEASKSSARQMAERSGAYFGDAPTSAQDSLAKATAAAGKPACVREGGSLLSPLYALYQALRDKCSSR